MIVGLLKHVIFEIVWWYGNTTKGYTFWAYEASTRVPKWFILGLGEPWESSVSEIDKNVVNWHISSRFSVAL